MIQSKIRIIRLRLNPERNTWDKEISTWLDTIPLGYRAKAIKDILLKTIAEKREGEVASSSRGNPPAHEKLDQLFEHSAKKGDVSTHTFLSNSPDRVK
jgi:hypothetical protein